MVRFVYRLSVIVVVIVVSIGQWNRTVNVVIMTRVVSIMSSSRGNMNTVSLEVVSEVGTTTLSAPRGNRYQRYRLMMMRSCRFAMPCFAVVLVSTGRVRKNAMVVFLCRYHRAVKVRLIVIHDEG